MHSELINYHYGKVQSLKNAEVRKKSRLKERRKVFKHQTQDSKFPLFAGCFGSRTGWQKTTRREGGKGVSPRQSPKQPRNHPAIMADRLPGNIPAVGREQPGGQ